MNNIFCMQFILALLVACVHASAGFANSDRQSSSASAAVSERERAVDLKWVPLRLSSNGLPIVAVTINGLETQAILDTGASSVAIDSGLATRLKLTADSVGRANMVGTGHGSTLPTVPGVEVAIGTLRLPEAKVAIADLARLRESGETSFGAIVGVGTLGGTVIEIDFSRMMFRVSNARPDTSGFRAVPLSVSGRVPVALMELAEGPAKLVLIDTGKSGGLAVTPAVFHTIHDRDKPSTTVARAGLGGTSIARLAATPRISINGIKINNVALEAEVEDQFMARAGADAMLGMQVLQQLNMILDLRGRQAFFAPSGVKPPPQAKSTSGLQFSYRRDSLEIAHVMASSPAMAAGWRAGDRICHVDGVPAATVWGDRELRRWGTRAPGRMVRFGMCDGQTRTLTLAAFY